MSQTQKCLLNSNTQMAYGKKNVSTSVNLKGTCRVSSGIHVPCNYSAMSSLHVDLKVV